MRETVPPAAVDGRAMIGLPPARQGGAPDEVHLPANARVDAKADRVGTDLTGQVDLERRVDRHDLVVLADQRRVVGAVAGMELDERVVVHEVVEALGADDEARDDASGVDALAPVGDDARLDQIDDAVREHLGVDAEVVLVVEAAQHGVRDCADAHLQRRAVLDQRGDVLADGLLHGVDGRDGWLVQRPVGVDERVSRSTWTSVLPCVRGIRSLISATTWRAESAAASAASTEVPSVQ